jgi:hypothetical protein
LVDRRLAGIAMVNHTDARGDLVFEQACKMGLEGIVSKRLSKPYQSGRSGHWLKVKNPTAPRRRGITTAVDGDRSSICVDGEASSLRCRHSRVHRYCGCCARPAESRRKTQLDVTGRPASPHHADAVALIGRGVFGPVLPQRVLRRGETQRTLLRAVGPSESGRLRIPRHGAGRGRQPQLRFDAEILRGRR